jgi:hypothetical protein
MNPNDPIRREILKFAYDVHRRVVKSEGGQVTGATLVSEVRSRSGAERAGLAENLDYLVGTGHMEHILQPLFHDGQVGLGMHRHYYRITAKGVNAMEHQSEFTIKTQAASISITNQNGVAIVGDGNTVSVTGSDLTSLLITLKALVQGSSSLTTEAKSDAVADIQTIEAQLTKTKPNREILSSAWKGVESVVTAAEFSSLVVHISEFVRALL